MKFDFYYELQKCKNKSSLYYMDAREQEVIIFQQLLQFFDEDKRKQIISIYEGI